LKFDDDKLIFFLLIVEHKKRWTMLLAHCHNIGGLLRIDIIILFLPILPLICFIYFLWFSSHCLLFVFHITHHIETNIIIWDSLSLIVDYVYPMVLSVDLLGLIFLRIFLAFTQMDKLKTNKVANTFLVSHCGIISWSFLKDYDLFWW